MIFTTAKVLLRCLLFLGFDISFRFLFYMKMNFCLPSIFFVLCAYPYHNRGNLQNNSLSFMNNVRYHEVLEETIVGYPSRFICLCRAFILSSRCSLALLTIFWQNYRRIGIFLPYTEARFVWEKKWNDLKIMKSFSMNEIFTMFLWECSWKILM